MGNEEKNGLHKYTITVTGRGLYKTQIPSDDKNQKYITAKTENALLDKLYGLYVNKGDDTLDYYINQGIEQKELDEDIQ